MDTYSSVVAMIKIILFDIIGGLKAYTKNGISIISIIPYNSLIRNAITGIVANVGRMNSDIQKFSSVLENIDCVFELLSCLIIKIEYNYFTDKYHIENIDFIPY